MPTGLKKLFPATGVVVSLVVGVITLQTLVVGEAHTDKSSPLTGIPRAWIIDGDLTDERGAASRIDYFTPASTTLGILRGPDDSKDYEGVAEDLEVLARQVGRAAKDQPPAVLALRPYDQSIQGVPVLVLQRASAAGRPCIDQAERFMPQAMQIGEVRRIGFSCLATNDMQSTKGECNAVPKESIEPPRSTDLSLPIIFAGSDKAWTLTCHLLP